MEAEFKPAITHDSNTAEEHTKSNKTLPLVSIVIIPRYLAGREAGCNAAHEANYDRRRCHDSSALAGSSAAVRILHISIAFAKPFCF
jgi:hypothetical protein